LYNTVKLLESKNSVDEGGLLRGKTIDPSLKTLPSTNEKTGGGGRSREEGLPIDKDR